MTTHTRRLLRTLEDEGALIMYLLVQCASATSSFTLNAAGRTWELEHFEPSTPVPGYSCVSYAWGVGKIAHPFGDGEISSRALRVLEAAARFASTDALWIDALCVPLDASERQLTLRQLGSIYANAHEVLVVLSEAVQPLFDDCHADRVLSIDALRTLEQELWVKRFWTYQELALAKELRFIIERGCSFAVAGMQFLNKVGEPLARARPSELSALPAVDNLTDVLASWIHGYGQPFAYQIMAGLAQREAERAADRFNAVLGVIDPTANFTTSSDVNEASEQFMARCEVRGDLSFVYARSLRSTAPGRSWRPECGELLPLLAWHTFGKGQQGTVFDSHAAFEDLHVEQQGSLSEQAANFIVHRSLQGTTGSGGQPLSMAAAQALAAMGASSLGPALELERGLFFPTQARRVSSEHLVLVASEVRWVHGAPALLVEALPSRRYRCLDCGIFLGPTRPGTTLEIE
ncbi:MAG TPA: HET domain-containing protein [Polyangiaceae bacterium]|nr:HET domain-containing protein [Polyangiaceae bacterium]